MEINIRKATKVDMKAVLELINELAVFEKEPEAVIIDENDLIRDGFGENPAFHCFVAEANGKIEGMALLYFRYSTWKGKTVHLEDLVVREKFRGKGLGSALYTKVIKFAAEQKVKRAEWVVLNWNKEAADFYRRSGADVMEDWNTVQINEKSMHSYLQNKGIL
ncbi:GNAT family N-acetyltransferase [Christiangramia forsetii]|uniref:GNAT family acetyltransferase-possibly polyamine acetyltransferase n=2 Tax=Christiangramia forsetii TaxID=411153 RepID=A0M763_CHRFK|nr:GNAT family N-acetyltransferase [Christiangramia forsetii]GGG28622.1 N-acetyltransferase [Christiangramia forsetii]CAL68458.1 GNAT family acetyltransferase-possibly polyamine acetyltransferase [Christiangramia forsetii KT0803]